MKATPYFGRQRHRYPILIRQERPDVVTVLGKDSESSRIGTVKKGV